MGSYLGYVDYFKNCENKTAEIMAHPTTQNGKIVDIISITIRRIITILI